jgi:protein-S-isoprenylcysteine O-methyltransferase Ste14
MLTMESRTTPPKMFFASLLAGGLQFAIAIVLFGGWKAFASHPALIALIVFTFAMMCIAPFSNVNLNSGEKEDRANRWVFVVFGVVALASALIPPYADRVGFWTIDGETTRWIGVAVYVLGGALRLYPVFVLGRRFSGLVAIQSNHQLETRGIYSVIRNPSYLGMIVNMIGWGLAFRGWTGVAIAFLLLIPLVGRIRSEERLLREHFGSQYDEYCTRTWRLIPGLY